jgi:hypothetical protein
MIGNANPLVNNNIINRRPQIPQDYMPNNSNNRMNNMNNNIKNTNARIGLKMNPNKTNNMKNNTNNVSNNNYMNRNINNNINRNLSSNNNMNSDNMINKALSMIRIEFRKKDEKIKSLELKVAELENQLKLLTRNNAVNNNDYSNQIANNNFVRNSNNFNEQQKKIGKNFTFSEKYSDEIHYMKNIEDENMLNNNNMNRISKMRENNFNQNNNVREINYQNNSNNQYNVNRINENDYMSNQAKKGEPLNNDAQRENSIKTWNSGNYHGWSKLDVKLYLKEVKSKLEPMAFKEFIQSIKLLTSTKGEGNINKSSIVERVRNLLGERHDDLFIKFKNIIGYNE